MIRTLVLRPARHPFPEDLCEEAIGLSVDEQAAVLVLLHPADLTAELRVAFTERCTELSAGDGHHRYVGFDDQGERWVVELGLDALADAEPLRGGESSLRGSSPQGGGNCDAEMQDLGPVRE
jgi:hypothetical protein